jgi:release factor glutamine methyltransferase
MTDKDKSLDRVRRELTRRLSDVSPTPALDARLLLQHVTGLDRAGLILHDQSRLSPEQEARLTVLMRRRLAGEPIAYLLGEKEFWSLPLKVTEDTLIPRPETEMLVEMALTLAERGHSVVDLGTGSGAIAIALAHERPDLDVTATDISSAALAVARENGHRHGVRVEWLLSDWGEQLRGRRFHLVLSNPPYIPEGDPHLTGDGVRFEPRHALVSANQGLEDIGNIVAFAAQALYPGGWLLLEHGSEQGPAVLDMMTAWGLTNTQTLLDGEHRPRVSMGQKSHADANQVSGRT